ncbi:MAG: RNA polymerase sigma factor [Gammaproteobacteria bacterium]|nr:MAG: RNA polymerase sigma factor [Gammaproteobacteria bacterium]
MHVADVTMAAPLPGTVSDERLGVRLLERRAALDKFLAGVQRRAFRIAQLSVRNRDDALDIVQDAMLNLARGYAQAPAQEWPPIFFRILQNRIRDHQRRGAVRRRVMAFFSGSGAQDDDADDVLAAVPGPATDGPEQRSALNDAMGALEAALHALPGRQREAFLLRTVEGLDVAATATAMGCTEGSVKTHYSRAVHSLRSTLGEHWP